MDDPPWSPAMGCKGGHALHWHGGNADHGLHCGRPLWVAPTALPCGDAHPEKITSHPPTAGCGDAS
jgi:hypothetical protein